MKNAEIAVNQYDITMKLHRVIALTFLLLVSQNAWSSQAGVGLQNSLSLEIMSDIVPKEDSLTKIASEKLDFDIEKRVEEHKEQKKERRRGNGAIWAVGVLLIVIALILVI
ncbi:MAG: hypothetical protein JJU34_12085 [Lunatimonas sp.]|nr:hypothetical protein [Lunatimonas sp.]